MIKKYSKYGVRTDALGKLERTIDGIIFDSKAEASRYAQLKLYQRAGEISGLAVHVRMPIDVNGRHICAYEADFTYWKNMKLVVEDVKGAPLTAIYRMKKKLVKACLGIDIVEIRS